MNRFRRRILLYFASGIFLSFAGLIVSDIFYIPAAIFFPVALGFFLLGEWMNRLNKAHVPTTDSEKKAERVP